MFTGIIEAKGHVSSIEEVGGDVRLTITSQQLDFSDIALGDSVAMNGVCLTVIEFDANAKNYVVDVSQETIQCTSLKSIKEGLEVNLEKAMLPTTRFGGHIVSGHVDGLGEVVAIKDNARAKDYYVKSPDDLIKYIAPKGSVTVDGVSLTVNSVDDTVFRLTIIPHTQEVTTIGQWVVGQQVNLEIDVVARYLEQLLKHRD